MAGNPSLSTNRLVFSLTEEKKTNGGVFSSVLLGKSRAFCGMGAESGWCLGWRFGRQSGGSAGVDSGALGGATGVVIREMVTHTPWVSRCE
ncbi:hypothetical protein J2S37_000104 [Corynebacterium felinum]|uniref:Uncharacterized protein n=1 Tax=Corynebacterium felinum TaxID=131318 RepID=A0ABU2B4N5_9CORY|nr:hypothetical protein [Corynebacterium felinum]